MKTPQFKFKTFLLAFSIMVLTMSCNKSTDLISDYIIAETPEAHQNTDLAMVNLDVIAGEEVFVKCIN
ncbi:hypothetical protein JQC67_09875 [Aurantibacter crassamenti]|uniref:hypothetical protein n=1 Tax=Aurantibacter crassamenti TaxID=1837375 RepID=UPI001939F1DB|nr:hypothetical protein [Aurantibacter crassamenti]MBM1106445.1 hypothetical protein [Aurantibacter crassamenti]